MNTLPPTITIGMFNHVSPRRAAGQKPLTNKHRHRYNERGTGAALRSRRNEEDNKINNFQYDILRSR